LSSFEAIEQPFLAHQPLGKFETAFLILGRNTAGRVDAAIANIDAGK
jgi:hypothetical protein